MPVCTAQLRVEFLESRYRRALQDPDQIGCAIQDSYEGFGVVYSAHYWLISRGQNLRNTLCLWLGK